MNEKLLQTYYTNPLFGGDFPDPSVIAVPGEGYYAFATHDEFSPTMNNILLKHTLDFTHWSETGGALIAPPVWAGTSHRFWCPQVVKVGAEYRLYYAAEPDTKDGMCLALAISDKPTGFCDIGTPLAQVPGSTYQMIDPCFFIDPKSGRHLLYYGSAHQPIRVVEMAGDGRTFTGEPLEVLFPNPDNIFERLREGAFVTYHPKFDRYLMWVSGSNTWAEKSYAVSVYWSKDPVSGFAAIPGQHLVLQPNEYWDAPGQNCIITDSAGSEWIIYHAVDPQERYIPGTDRFLRKICMDKILYSDDGWPYIQGGSPSHEQQPGPVILVRDEIISNQ